MSSPQETVIRSLSESAIGAPFVFAPDIYRKGRGSLEPADLAWVCNECAVLLYMHESESASAEALSEHNIKQSRGWIRAWLGGQPLTGSNAYQSFNIKASDLRHVVVLSVVSGTNAIGRYESDLLSEPRSAKLRITMAATLPASALEDVAHRDGGLLDLLHLVHRLSSAGPLSEPDCIKLVEQIYEDETTAGLTMARYAGGGTHNPTVDTIARAMRILDLRPGAFAKNEPFRVLVETLNDLSWRQSSELIGRIGLSIQALDMGKAERFQFDLKLGEYTWMVSILGSLSDRASLSAVDAWRESPIQRTPYPPIFLMMPLGAPLIVSSHRRSGPSQMERLLDSLESSNHLAGL